MKIKINPPYKHLVQKPGLCGPCCLQMILLRRGLKWIDQEEIAYTLKTPIYFKDKDINMYKLPIVNDQKVVGNYLKDLEGEYIKEFFKKFKLFLESKVYYISEIDDPQKFIYNNLKSGKDIIINFWFKPLKSGDYGHFMLISEIVGDKIKLCDPANQNHKSFWWISLSKAIEGMSKEFDGKERGFAVVSG